MRYKKRYKKKRKKASKNRIVPILLLFIFLTIFIFVSVYFFKYAFCNIKYFSINQIEISGTNDLSQDKLKEKMVGFIGRQLYKVPVDSIAHYFNDIERIKSLRVQRKFPNAISIKIKERRVDFYYKDKTGELYPISGDGTILSNPPSYVQYDLPIISGFKIKNLKPGLRISHPRFKIILSLRDAIKKIDESFLEDISEFYYRDGELCFVENQNGCKIIVGNEDFENRLRSFLCMYKSLGIEKRRIYDLRFSNQIILK